MTGFSPNTQQIRDNGYGWSRGGRTINGVVIHHGAGTNVLRYVAEYNSRNSHPTYHVDQSGEQTGIVNPGRAPASTAHRIDQEAVAFELNNSVAGGNWPIADATMETVLQTILWHESQSPRKGFAKNVPGTVQNEFFVAWHQQYHQTACPGPYIIGRLDWMVEELRARKGGGASVPAHIPSTPTNPSPIPQPGNTWERAIGGEPDAPFWPRGPLMERLQRALASMGRYDGIFDGIGGIKTAKGVQITLNYSGRNGGVLAPNGARPTSVDGALGRFNAYGVQEYARDFGAYGGYQDGDPREGSWSGFCLGLERG
jgi:hypothetical protein